MSGRIYDRSYLLREERLASLLRLVGAAILVVMSVVFTPLIGWAPLALAAAAIGWTGYMEWATRRPGEARRYHHASLAVDAGLATACYVVFLPDPTATPPVLFPLVTFRLAARYGWPGAVAGVGAFAAAITARAAINLLVLPDGQVRPPVLLVWVLVAAATVALAVELRARYRPTMEVRPAPRDPPEDGLAARLAALLDHANDEFVLTRREWDVFVLLGEGATCRQIASQLHVAVSTVRNHIHNMKGKLGLESREDLIALAEAVLVLRPTATVIPLGSRPVGACTPDTRDLAPAGRRPGHATPRRAAR